MPQLSGAGALNDRLSRYVCLEPRDVVALSWMSRNRKKLRSHETLIHEGSPFRTVCVILSGIAFRYKMLPDGRRQILGYLLEGDFCDAEFRESGNCDHSVGLLTDAEVAMIPISEFKSVVRQHPGIGRALKLAEMIEGAILREWLLNVGQRDAFQRIAHLLCEISARLECLGSPSTDDTMSIPFTQVELADTVGLTVVHVNRCLQRLRREKLIAWRRRRVAVLDLRRLQQIADFDQSYLNPDQSLARSTERFAYA